MPDNREPSITDSTSVFEIQKQFTLSIQTAVSGAGTWAVNTQGQLLLPRINSDGKLAAWLIPSN